MQAITTMDVMIPTTLVSESESPPAKPVCPRCAGAGYYTLDVSYDHPEFGKLQPCNCEHYQQQITPRRDSLRKHLANVLGQQHAGCTFDSFDAGWTGDSKASSFLTSVKNFCQDYAKACTGWLMLHGEKGGWCGSGKSHLAAAIANEFSARGGAVAYATVPDIFGFIMGDWSKSEERIDALGVVGLLVLDDAGKEAVKGGGIDQFRDKFFRILGKRDRTNGPTIITSNYTLDELAAMPHYDPAIISRIAGQTDGRRILMRMKDYRRRGG